MKISEENLEQWFLDRCENLCDYCVHSTDCGRCDQYRKYSDEEVIEKGLEAYKKWTKDQIDCTYEDFGECDKLKSSPCHDCVKEGAKDNFEWNGRNINE